MKIFERTSQKIFQNAIGYFSAEFQPIKLPQEIKGISALNAITLSSYFHEGKINTLLLAVSIFNYVSTTAQININNKLP